MSNAFEGMMMMSEVFHVPNDGKEGVPPLTKEAHIRNAEWNGDGQVRNLVLYRTLFLRDDESMIGDKVFHVPSNEKGSVQEAVEKDNVRLHAQGIVPLVFSLGFPLHPSFGRNLFSSLILITFGLNLFEIRVNVMIQWYERPFSALIFTFCLNSFEINAMS